MITIITISFVFLWLNKKMKTMTKPTLYLLDVGSGITLLGGIFSGQWIAIILGGIASILAAINHAQQIIERRKLKKKINDPISKDR